MTRHNYSLPVVLKERLMSLSEKKDKPINALITEALIRMYPELRSLPAHTLASLLHIHPQKAP